MSDKKNQNVFKIGTSTNKKLAVKQITRDRRLQARTDTDTGGDVDELRCQNMAVDVKAGVKFPPVKVMLVKDFPGAKDEEVYVLWDGFHTIRAHEIAGVKEINCSVWEGNWGSALTAAATTANREHEKNGKPLSSKDKLRAVSLLARAYKDSDIPKSEWPSNRDAAEMCGCSRQLVNDMDPFDRGKGDQREAKNAAKRLNRVAEKAQSSSDHFEIVQKSTAQVLDIVKAASPEAAIAAYVEKKPTANTKELLARGCQGKPTESGKEVKEGAFDWKALESAIGFVMRGFDGAGTQFQVKKTEEYKEAFAAYDTFCRYIARLRKQVQQKEQKG